MANLQQTLRGEIARLARKEIRAEVQSLHGMVTSQRKLIASLRKRIDTLERALKAVAKDKRKAGRMPPAAAPGEEHQLRFRAGGFATLRAKLGLSAKDMGALIGVSGLTVYKWEKGQARPRAKQLAAIAAARGIGKREAQQRLEALAPKAPVRRQRPAAAR